MNPALTATNEAWDRYQEAQARAAAAPEDLAARQAATEARQRYVEAVLAMKAGWGNSPQAGRS